MNCPNSSKLPSSPLPPPQFFGRESSGTLLGVNAQLCKQLPLIQFQLTSLFLDSLLLFCHQLVVFWVGTGISHRITSMHVEYPHIAGNSVTMIIIHYWGGKERRGSWNCKTLTEVSLHQRNNLLKLAYK